MQLASLRPWLASTFAVVAGAAMLGHHRVDAHVVAMPIALFAVAALLFHSSRLPLQVTARAAVWTGLVLNMLLAHLIRQDTAYLASLSTVYAALALLAAGPISGFQHVAYRRTLMLSLVLALGDAFTLWMWTSIAVIAHAPARDAAGFAICAVVTTIAAVGLYRMRLWGLALGVAANIGIAIAFATRAIDVEELRIVFIATALAQVLVALPVVVGIIRGRDVALPAWAERAARALFPVAIVAISALAVQPLFGRSILVRIATALLH